MKALYTLIILVLVVHFVEGCSPSNIKVDDVVTFRKIDSNFEDSVTTDNYAESTVADNSLFDTIPDQSTESTDVVNPYDNIDSLSFWQYYLFELNREATIIHIENALCYNTTVKLNRNLLFNFSIDFPGKIDESAIYEKMNEYYINKLFSMREKESQLIEYLVDYPLWNSCEYSQTALYAYTWGRYYTIVIDEYLSLYRSFSTPICDTFDICKGERLNLNDVFTVDSTIYNDRIREALQKPTTAHQPLLMPEYEQNIAITPLPKNENFILAPTGLVLIYQQGEISSMSEGAVILFVDYVDIADILAVNLN